MMANITVAPEVGIGDNYCCVDFSIEEVLWNDYANNYNCLVEIIKKSGADTCLLKELVVKAVMMDRMGLAI